MKPIQLMLLIACAVLFTACGSKLAITNVNFAHPFEMILQVNESGNVADVRSGLTFNVSELLKKENKSQSDFIGKNLHVIRNNQGYYFITAAGFKNVYIMEIKESALQSIKIVKVSDEGLNQPAFNQRNPYIQLIDGNMSLNLNKAGIN
jgi:hypothetical protein